jgi:hypothetical protein
MAKQVAKVRGFKYNKNWVYHSNRDEQRAIMAETIGLWAWFEQEKYVLFYEKKSAIHLSKNGSFHLIPKHIEIRYRWIQDMMNLNKCKLRRCT